jgi:hypothetical protein
MSLIPSIAEKMLRVHFGAPINPVPHGEHAGQENGKVLGFAAPDGRVLALDRKIDGKTHIWFQPPPPPKLAGVSLRPTPPINSNLSGPLAVLNKRQGLRVEIDSEASLQRFLDWYSGATADQESSDHALKPTNFHDAFARFQRLIAANDKGHAFTNFDEGVAAVWEGYKPRLRKQALSILAPDAWSESDIGSGAILQRVIDAIEIQDTRINLTNNLVFWQNRFGHANRDHRILLEAISNGSLRSVLERLIFGLYRADADEGATFDRLSELTGAKYPLLAYFYFLKDMDRFLPIQPTTFDRAFSDLGIDLVTLRNCSWENYQRFNNALGEVRNALASINGLSAIRLIDAHSFCWMLEKLENHDGNTANVGLKDSGRVLGGRDKSIIAMRLSVENTVRSSNGQIVERTVKNKELQMSSAELEKLLASLLELQDNRCALTGIPFHFLGPNADKNLLPSVDRIDSDGHYEAENLQIVCQFINFWKSDADNEEFKRLLMLVRGVEAAE